ncbi:MAG: hypothetical protein RL095_655 [Verrucomicrobiota bacterium]|jgi:nitrilase
MDSFRLALAQSCSGDQVEPNLDWARQQMAEAATKGAQLLLLPECILCQAKPEGIAPSARTAADWQALLGPLSAFHKLPAVWGGLPEWRDGKIHNSSFCFDASGASLGIYRKTHLFQLFAGERQVDETAIYAFGEGAPLVLHLDGWTFGLTICYDLRFPELWRRYAGADCILNTAAFTRKTGRAHWDLLLRARAVENQCFVAAAAQCGVHPGTGIATYGHSCVIDPWGELLAQSGDEPGLLIQEMRRSRLDEIRGFVPSLFSRRM